MNEPIYLVKGYGANLEVFEDKVVIKRCGVGSFFIHGLKGDKSFFFQDITAIQLKNAGILSGYIQFTIPGGNENVKGLFAAVNDENTFTFRDKNLNESMKEIKNYIEQKKSNINNNSSTQISVADEIIKFKELLDSGVLTPDEFDKKKQELLNSGFAEQETFDNKVQESSDSLELDSPKLAWGKCSHRAIVIFLLIAFFPLGLFLLWKSNKFGKISKVVITCIIAIVFLMALATDDETASSSAKKQKTEPLSYLKQLTWDLSKDIIKKSLSSPSTANFGKEGFFPEQSGENCVTDLGGNTYLVKGWVDSQNGFGAIVRTNFSLKMKCDGEKWELLSNPIFEER